MVCLFTFKLCEILRNISFTLPRYKMTADESQNKVILATGGYDHIIHFWQAHSGVRQCSVQYPTSQINSMEIHPNKQLLAAAGFQHIRMYDIYSSNSNPVVNYEGAPKNFTAVGFQEDGRWMYTGSEDNTTRVWDLRSRTLQCQRLFGAVAPVNCVCLHPNQCELYIGDQSGAIYLWDLKSGDDPALKKPFFKVSEPRVSIQYIHIDSEGTCMAAVDNKGNCYTFIIGSRGKMHAQPTRHLKFQAHDTYAIKCKFSPDSTLLVTTSADCSAKIWRTADLNLLPSNQNVDLTTENGSEWQKIPITPMIQLKDNNQRWVWDVAFSADSQYLVTASSDNLARLWCISKGEVKREYSGHSKALTALAFRDGI
ncbi:target of rapamycin complex subunit lst8 [Trichonephila clavata]|uniref:Target of rapamycin complex subunit lst8 n=2 Tax=Trichonephila clavata TaxID=2740835 RepID=A0A8X6GZ66_TRICU|nr:target of rapamycin complex subunit lst8 [Trichonephila clavata]